MKNLITCVAAGALLGTTGAVDGRGLEAYWAAKAAQDEPGSGEQALINVNNMSMWFRRDGMTGHNPLDGNSGVTFPRSTGRVIYWDGLIWGGIVKDGDPQELRVGGQTYRIGTVPGRILSRGEAEDPEDPGVRIYRIRRDYQTADLRLDASESLGIDLKAVTDSHVEQVRAQYERDWREWPWEKGAPYYDNDGSGSYDPEVDEPGVAGADQLAWFVVNDLDPGASQSLYGSKPIGLEAQMLFWGYARTDALGDVIFRKYTVIYKGTSATPDTARVEDMYFAQWSDPDLGDYGDDFAGSDVGLSLGYVYNSTNRDHTYDFFGLAPPAVGYDFLQGPVVPAYVKDENGDTVLDEAGEPIVDESSEAIFNFSRRSGFRNLPMTSFVYFAAGSAISDPSLGEYVGTQQWYNLLRGYQPQPDIDNPVPYTNPLTDEDTFFTLDGDPTIPEGWNDGVPLPSGDRRIVLNTGPFEMALGDTQEVVVALLGGISNDRLLSISKLKFNDKFVQEAYDNLFEVPSPPAGPDVRISELDGRVLLDWSWNEEAIALTEGDDGSGFLFEGYNLYQLPSAEAPLGQGTRLATYDLENEVTTVLGTDLDVESGVILEVPLQVGTNFGVRRRVWVTHDALRGGPLVNGQEYYFAVTAYSHNAAEEAVVTTLESSPRTLICVPRKPALGTRYGTEADESMAVEHVGGSEGSVGVVVVDPTRTTGDSYQVEFGEKEGAVVWSLVNTTSGERVLEDQSQTGRSMYMPDHGFELLVADAPFAIKELTWLRDGEPNDDDRWLTGVNWGGRSFFGGVDLGAFFFGSSIVTGGELVAVEMRFSNTNTQKAYRYLRGGDPNYGFQDFVEVPFTVWDIDSDPPRQLNVAFVENSGSTSEDQTWLPADSEEDRPVGGREYLFILKSDYSDQALEQYSGMNIAAEAAAFDVLYAGWLKLRDEHDSSELADGQVMRFTPYRANTLEDVFRFEVPGALFDADLQKEDVALINVFPNPYYGVNEAETSPYSHFVTFSHLPQRATIRLYDLAGNLVRVLDKSDPDPFLRWDLNNHNGLPVASGIYLAHVELPDVGKNRTLRVVVVQEQQFLESY